MCKVFPGQLSPENCQKTAWYRKLDKYWHKTQKDIDIAHNTTSLTHMRATQKALSAHFAEWRECLGCIVKILDRLDTADALAEKKDIQPDALNKEETCKITLANLKTRIEDEEERRLLLVKDGKRGEADSILLPSKSTILRSPIIPADLKPLTNPYGRRAMLSPAILRPLTSP
ncbi:UNVERIFIED_CONTAM: hypothetical protein K2H54_055749 [Gekko kuhli]